MVVASSNYYRADLGCLGDSVEQQLREWAAVQCAEHKLFRKADSGEVVLYARRGGEPKTSKALKMVLRPVLQKLGLPIEGFVGDWLQVMGVDAFTAAMRDGPAPPDAQDEPRRAPPSSTPRPCTAFTKLSDGFDEQAHALLRELREGMAAPCAA